MRGMELNWAGALSNAEFNIADVDRHSLQSLPGPPAQPA